MGIKTITVDVNRVEKEKKVCEMEKILVAVDGSPASMRAARAAVEMARKFYADLIFLSVVKNPDLLVRGRVGENYIYNLSNLEGELSHQYKEMLDEFVSQLPDLSNIAYEKIVKVGVPYDEIVKMAEKRGVDLIVIGRRGFSPLKRILLGSVSQNVVSHAKCPVMVVNDTEEH